MTLPTRAQLDAELARSQAGISALSGDLTDAEERAVALDWLERFYKAASERNA